MLIRKIISVGGFGTLLFLGSCQELPVNASRQIENSQNNSEMLVLGKKLENPYSVSSMKRARDSLVERGSLSKSVVTDKALLVTHYYIKFKPENDAEVVTLKKDTSIVLWDYPLDYEIKEGGTVYRDPGVPANAPGYLYTAVPVGKKLPSVKYEILEELVLNDDMEDSYLSKITATSYYSLLEQEALRITGNLPENKPNLSKSLGSWRPTGNVQVYDQVLGRNVPVVGVNVRTRNWFKWWDGATDINGNFRCSKTYLGDIAYSLRWQYAHNRFDIREGKTGQAFYNGPNQKRGAWNLVISSGLSLMYAHIFRAGAFYVGQEPFELKDKPFDLISIQAIDGNRPEDYASRYRPSNQNVMVWRNASGGDRFSSLGLFHNTTHELGHAHHHEIYDKDRDFTKVSFILLEGWAVAVSYYLTACVYDIPLKEGYNEYHVQRSSWGNYTPIMLDLVDSYNQRSYDSKCLQDRVSGYTLQQLQTIIAKGGCITITDLKNEINALPLPSGMTKAIIDEYFNQY